MCSLCKSTAELQAEFEAAKAGVDPETISRVMKGLPVDGDWTPKIHSLRSAWSAYHARLRV
jgi:hypothetical protein